MIYLIDLNRILIGVQDTKGGFRYPQGGPPLNMKKCSELNFRPFGAKTRPKSNRYNSILKWLQMENGLMITYRLTDSHTPNLEMLSHLKSEDLGLIILDHFLNFVDKEKYVNR